MKKLIILGVLLATAGCAPDIYYKDGATQQAFSQDQGSCQMFAMGIPRAQAPYVPPTYTSTTIANASYVGSGNFGTLNGAATTTVTPDYSGQAFANLGTAIGNAVEQRNAMRACMQSRGYTLNPSSETSAASAPGGSPSAVSLPPRPMAETTSMTHYREAVTEYNECIIAHNALGTACGHAPISP